MKVGKEQIVGLLTALSRFVAQDEAAENARLSAMTARFAGSLEDLSGLSIDTIESPGRWTKARLRLKSPSRLSAIELARRLMRREPSIYLEPGLAREGLLDFDPFCLKPGEVELVSAAIREELSRDR